jgi:peptide/nickel transport system ATP-binding protein
VQAQVLNLLNELKRDFNFTYIFISHDLSVVKFMSDRMVVMNQGKDGRNGRCRPNLLQSTRRSTPKSSLLPFPKGRLEDIIASIKLKEEYKKELA